MIYLLSILAGLLMTFFPCVLPVIGLKLRAFAEPDKKIPYLIGVFLSFMILATMAVVTGVGLSQMSYIWFRVALVVVCFLMSIHLVGLFRFNMSVTLPTFAGPFGTGLLTVALGSSCSVPFLAPVLTYCASVGVLETYGIFSCLAFGFVSPFLLPIPMPKPGPWLDKFEKGCGVALFLVVLWLLSTLTHRPMEESINIPTDGNRAIIVSASWCLNCPLAHMAWHDPEVIELLEVWNIQPVVLDWTNRDPRITAFLRRHDHQSVPFALIEVNGRVTALSGIYTSSNILEALRP